MSHPSLRFDTASAEELAEAFETTVSLLLEVLDDIRKAGRHGSPKAPSGRGKWLCRRR